MNASDRIVFLAGASGAIGRRLAPLLIKAGWRVVGTTRSIAKADSLNAIGVEPVIVDAFDREKLRAAVMAARPTAIIHQLTDLPPGLDPALMDSALYRNARLRDEGTRNLVEAAEVAGVKRLIAQSVTFAYAAGSEPHLEDEPLALDASGIMGVSVRAVAALEQQILQAAIPGIVLRYGFLYGPGTGFDRPPGPGGVHVDAAARAAQLALESSETGAFNVAEVGPVSSEKAHRLLKWEPSWRRDYQVTTDDPS